MLALMLACAEGRYLCGPGTQVEGDWCVASEDTRDPANTDDTGTESDADGDTDADTDTDTDTDTGEEPEPARLVINEFMASNDTKVYDEASEYDDWLEIYNAGGQPMALDDVSLTDDTATLDLYTFPAGSSLGPGEWIFVWCDQTPDQGGNHANFTLQSAGDRVLLVRDPLGSAEVLDDVEWTDMAAEVAAARYPDGSDDWVITENVTPGAANGE
ncbi:MAG: lamin tail domain-containing protein [Deltaproteobacteria bacterium]|nr:lamin tail domain-containing protein [Deltaproteobacteria bacterium]